MWVQSLGQEDPLEQGMATYSSILAWKIPWTGACGVTVHRVHRVGYEWINLARSTPAQRTSPCTEEGGSLWSPLRPPALSLWVLHASNVSSISRMTW